jgi:hypothetical protein
LIAVTPAKTAIAPVPPGIDLIIVRPVIDLSFCTIIKMMFESGNLRKVDRRVLPGKCQLNQDELLR